jgi:hypothetical protein
VASRAQNFKNQGSGDFKNQGPETKLQTAIKVEVEVEVEVEEGGND